MLNIYEGMPKSTQRTLQQELKIRWTYTSNAIEGNTISLGDTSFIIEQGLTVSGVSLREHEEVVGHARAVDIVYEMLSADIFTQNDLFKLHKAVQTSLVIDIECPIGDYKVEVNDRYIRVDGKTEHRYYPAPQDTKHLMNIWFGEFGDTSAKELTFLEVIKIYTRCHIGFASIHPFFDGNGRVARLVSNIFMLKNGFLPIIVDNKARQKYITLLSQYNINSKELDNKSTQIIEENCYFEELYEFFKEQYQNSQSLLDELKR